MIYPDEFRRMCEETDALATAPKQPTMKERARAIAVAEGMCQCSCCGGWFYDVPGNGCDQCNVR